WAIVDLIGKASHIRTVPVPHWVKDLIDDWFQSAGISNGRIFRRVTRAGTVWGSGLSEEVVWHVVRQYARKADIDKLAPHDLRRYAEFRTMPNGKSLSFPLKARPENDPA